jgi:hypothetical protein
MRGCDEATVSLDVGVRASLRETSSKKENRILHASEGTFVRATRVSLSLKWLVDRETR